VGGDPLNIEKFKATFLQAADEFGQGEFRSVGHAVEHRLAKECPTELHAIEAAGELSVAPDFHRMGMAGVVQGEIAVENDLIDPCFLAFRAGADDLFKRCVDTHFPRRVSQCRSRAVGNFEPLQRQNPSRIGGEYADAPAGHRHGEPARGVKSQELFRWNDGCHCVANFYDARVKFVTLFFGFLAVALVTGCTVAEQQPGELSQKLQQGIQGQGTLVPNSPTSDGFGSDYR